MPYGRSGISSNDSWHYYSQHTSRYRDLAGVPTRKGRNRQASSKSSQVTRWNSVNSIHRGDHVDCSCALKKFRWTTLGGKSVAGGTNSQSRDSTTRPLPRNDRNLRPGNPANSFARRQIASVKANYSIRPTNLPIHNPIHRRRDPDRRYPDQSLVLVPAHKQDHCRYRLRSQRQMR